MSDAVTDPPAFLATPQVEANFQAALACHPLATLALTLFLEREPQDATTVASGLWNGRRFASYRVVAGDILADMRKAGLLRQSAAGWYWLVTSEPTSEAPHEE